MFNSSSNALAPISYQTREQKPANVDAPGLMNFVPALAYHFCLNLPSAFTQPGSSTNKMKLKIYVTVCFYLPLKTVQSQLLVNVAIIIRSGRGGRRYRTARLG